MGEKGLWVLQFACSAIHENLAFHTLYLEIVKSIISGGGKIFSEVK